MTIRLALATRNNRGNAMDRLWPCRIRPPPAWNRFALAQRVPSFFVHNWRCPMTARKIFAIEAIVVTAVTVLGHAAAANGFALAGLCAAFGLNIDPFEFMPLVPLVPLACSIGLGAGIVFLSVAILLKEPDSEPDSHSKGERVSLPRDPNRFSSCAACDRSSDQPKGPETPLLQIPWEEVFADPELNAILDRWEEHRWEDDGGRPLL